MTSKRKNSIKIGKLRIKIIKMRALFLNGPAPAVLISGYACSYARVLEEIQHLAFTWERLHGG